MNYATESLQIHDHLSPFKNKPTEYGIEDVNMGKEKPATKFIFLSMHDSFPTYICKSFDQPSFSPRQVE